MKKVILLAVLSLNAVIILAQEKKTLVGFSVGTAKAQQVESSKLGIAFGADVYFFPVHFVGVSFRPGLSLYSYKVSNVAEQQRAEQVHLPLHAVLRAGKGYTKLVMEGGPDWILDVSGKGSPSTIGWDLAAGLQFDRGLGVKVKRNASFYTVMPEVRYSFLPDKRVIYFTLHFLG
jgi:hypothetical protein